MDQEELAELVNQYILEGEDVISALLKIAEDKGYDPEWIAPYVTGSLKDMVRLEGEQQGLLFKSSKPKVTFE